MCVCLLLIIQYNIYIEIKRGDGGRGHDGEERVPEKLSSKESLRQKQEGKQT